MKVSTRNLALVVACLCAAGSELVAQEEVRFQGTTTGCFFSTGLCNPETFAQLYDFSFNAGAFDATTTNGKLTLGSGANELGTFTLGGTPASYRTGGWNFLLNVVFSLPSLANPGALYTAVIGGIVRSETNGTVHVVFNEEPQVFTFDGPNGQRGYFSLVVPEMGVPVGTTGTIKGNIEATVTPEPATMALMATGLASLVPAVRRRRRHAKTT